MSPPSVYQSPYQSPVDRPGANSPQLDAYAPRWTNSAWAQYAMIALVVLILVFGGGDPR